MDDENVKQELPKPEPVKPKRTRKISEEDRKKLSEKMAEVRANRWKNHTKKVKVLPEQVKEEELPRVLPEDEIQKVAAKKPIEKTPTKSQEEMKKKKKPYCKLVFYEKPDENFKFKWGKKNKPIYGIEEVEEECEQESEEESEDEEQQRKNNMSAMARNFFG